MTIRALRSLVAAAFLAGTAVLASSAEKAYPNRQITIVVPIAAGGGGDAVARAIADGVAKQTGLPVIVINRPGGNGVIAAMMVANSAPDGYTVLLGFSGLVQNAALRKDIPDVLPTLEPVGQILSTGFAFAVSPTLKISTLDGLVQYAKANGSDVNYGTNGVGSIQHLDGQIFGRQAGIRMVNVAYKGGEVESLSAVMSGTIQSAFGSPGTFKTFQDAGRIRILAISGPKRNASLPAVPTFAELGYTNLDLMGWVGAFVNKATPPAVVSTLNNVMRQALIDNQSVRDRIAQVGFGVDVTSAQDFQRQISTEIARWRVLGADVAVN